MSSPTMADALNIFLSLTVDRCREVRSIIQSQGWRSVRPRFIFVSDLPSGLAWSPTNGERIALGAFAHLCNVYRRL